MDTRLSVVWRPARYFQPPTPAPAIANSATAVVGNLDLGFSDAGAEPIASIGIGCAPEAVRATGGTVGERIDCPLAVDERERERWLWLPVRGAGAPPSTGKRS